MLIFDVAVAFFFLFGSFESNDLGLSQISSSRTSFTSRALGQLLELVYVVPSRYGQVAIVGGESAHG